MIDYTPIKSYQNKDGKFTHFPGKKQKKKQLLMLQFLATKFEADKKYSEKEVNNVLNNFHTFNDPASLRRFMFGAKLLNRTLDGTQYWKVEKKK